MASVLVTGSSGFLGSHLREQIPNSDGVDLTPSKTTNIIADVHDFKDAAMYDVIFHMAAVTDIERGLKDPAETYKVNLCGTINLLKDFKGLFVFPSSFGVFNPLLCPYFLSKYMGEQIVRRHLKYLIFRLPNPFGPRSNSVVNKFLFDKQISIYGDGNQVRDFVYVDDVIEHFLGYWKLEFNRVYHIGSGLATSIGELANIINSLCPNPKPIVYLPERSFDIKEPIIRADRVCKTSLTDGIRRLLSSKNP